MPTKEESKLNTQDDDHAHKSQQNDQDLKINRKGFIETKGEVIELLPVL